MDRATFEALSEAEQVAQVLATMAEVVAEVGDEYAYDRAYCQYVCNVADPERRIYSTSDTAGMTLTPSCLIGVVLARLGWPLGAMLRNNGGGITGASFAADLHQATIDVMGAAQEHQDGGGANCASDEARRLANLTEAESIDRRWSTALRVARAEAERLGFSVTVQ